MSPKECTDFSLIIYHLDRVTQRLFLYVLLKKQRKMAVNGYKSLCLMYKSSICCASCALNVIVVVIGHIFTHNMSGKSDTNLRLIRYHIDRETHSLFYMYN